MRTVFRPDFPLVQLNNFVADGEPQSGPAGFMVLTLCELIENYLQIITIDTFSVID